jgi:hypothetical protein
MKIFGALIVAFLIVVFGSLAISLIVSKIANRGETEDPIVWIDKIPKEYLQLLKLPDTCCKTANGNTVFVQTTAKKYRNPISSFYIENKYYLQVYKMDTSFNYSLKNEIKESRSDADMSTFYTPYVLDDRTDMKFLYNANKPHKPKNIYFDLYGDSTHILKKNDTIAYYYTNCRNFSIKFNIQDQNDIYCECKSQSFSEVPFELMFLKQGTDLYMLTLSATNASTKLKQGMLYNLIFR